jgi:hypothetical protein
VIAEKASEADVALLRDALFAFNCESTGYRDGLSLSTASSGAVTHGSSICGSVRPTEGRVSGYVCSPRLRAKLVDVDAGRWCSPPTPSRRQTCTAVTDTARLERQSTRRGDTQKSFSRSASYLRGWLAPGHCVDSRDACVLTTLRHSERHDISRKHHGASPGHHVGAASGNTTTHQSVLPMGPYWANKSKSGVVSTSSTRYLAKADRHLQSGQGL